jgi:hypothetical protein
MARAAVGMAWTCKGHGRVATPEQIYWVTASVIQDGWLKVRADLYDLYHGRGAS